MSTAVANQVVNKFDVDTSNCVHTLPAKKLQVEGLIASLPQQKVIKQLSKYTEKN